MIVENIKIFSQNVCKNSLLVNTLLKTLIHFDIILIQEPPWSEICKIPSSSNCKGDPLIGTSHHPNWTTFTRIPSNNKNVPRVITYVNIRLSALHFLLHKDIFNHRDISLISFSNNNICYYIINVYSDSSHTALKYLKDTEVNINNVVLMTGDFNIRDSLWDLSFPFYLSISDDLIMIADSFNLALSSPTNPCPTKYSDMVGESNSIINLMSLLSRNLNYCQIILLFQSLSIYSKRLSKYQNYLWLQKVNMDQHSLKTSSRNSRIWIWLTLKTSLYWNK